jgi:hypothetical protein
MKILSKLKRGAQGFKKSFKDEPHNDELSIELDDDDITLVRNMFLSNMVPKNLSDRFTLRSVAKIWYDRGYDDGMEDRHNGF